MSRHVIDKTPRENSGARLRSFLAIARESGQHPAIRALSQRPAERAAPGRRVKEFLRIERGHTA
ncbi:hypothetical protein ACFQXB_00840 [Plastorhodobacter daqingensis]|uniref:Uncharacterized protein n=1 Tax=Plastorhodobacter daqingensis TaxID=1387281 RepID=A0ABW2UDT4_9RHOB